MSNHFHLAVTTHNANLPLCQLVGRYARDFNRNHQRRNHVFGGRYDSVVIASDGQLLATIRYVCRNPSRAGRVDQPQEWPWSSHPAALGLAPFPPFLDTKPVMFHPEAATGRNRFRDFVDETREADLPPPLPSQSGRTPHNLVGEPPPGPVGEQRRDGAGRARPRPLP